MSARRTTLLDPAQPSLFDPEPTPPAPTISQPEKAQPRRNRHHALDLPRPWAEPTPCAALCLTCGRPEDLGVCPGGCATVCGRPNRTGPVELCLLTTTVTARRIGPYATVTCPRCHRTHWHQPAPGRAYRIGQCGQPYIVAAEVTS